MSFPSDLEIARSALEDAPAVARPTPRRRSTSVGIAPNIVKYDWP